MRILLVSYEYPPIGGGAATAFCELLRELRKRDNLQVDVVTTHPRDFCKEPTLQYMGEGLRHTLQTLPIRKPCRHYWRASEVASWIWQARGLCTFMLRRYQYNLVHLWSGFPMPLLRWPVPVVISLLGSDVPHFNERLERWWYPLLIRYQWKHAARVVANSEELFTLAHQTWAGPIPIDVIPTGVDVERFYPPDIAPDPRRWITCGRLIPRKQIGTIIEMVNRFPGVTLTIAGDGPEREQLQRNLPLGSAMFGRIEPDAMPALYRTHGIYVHASIHEGLSNSVLEAKASGLPVVDVTQEPASRQLRGLLDYRPIYLEARRQAREEALKYSWAATTDAYVKVYQEVTECT